MSSLCAPLSLYSEDQLAKCTEQWQILRKRRRWPSIHWLSLFVYDHMQLFSYSWSEGTWSSYHAETKHIWFWLVPGWRPPGFEPQNLIYIDAIMTLFTPHNFHCLLDGLRIWCPQTP